MLRCVKDPFAVQLRRLQRHYQWQRSVLVSVVRVDSHRIAESGFTERYKFYFAVGAVVVLAPCPDVIRGGNALFQVNALRVSVVVSVRRSPLWSS